jgi:putative DNA primase/helicase
LTATLRNLRAYIEESRLHHEGYLHESTRALADYFMKQNSFAYLAGEHGLRVYSKGIYRYGGSELIRKEIYKVHPTALSDDISELIGKIKNVTEHDRSEFDSNPNELNLANGVLNFSTGEFMRHSRKRLNLIQYPIRYDRKAKCPLILKSIAQWHPSPTQQERLLDQSAYVLMKEDFLQKFFIHYGKPAAGKDTFLNVLRAALGYWNISSQSIRALSSNRFAPAKLAGKQANLCGETSRLILADTTTLNQLTGGGMLTAENKFGQPFQFVNHAKLFFAMNRIPKFENLDDAFYRRIEITVWDESFLGKEDVDLSRKLTTPRNLSGFLNELIPRMRRIHRTRRLKWQQSFTESKDRWDELAVKDAIGRLDHEKLGLGKVGD